ncbi:RNA polymerase sigma-70 factor [Pedobacter sp. MC2016-15]|jgi:RNA polymerase sigma-70 factor (ECF subfamily)|uniref:RNA polymerase sigma-70 factor n=1 Tax=Pedobacter sp. MC2016-15 TaxID=2994473 RepID=UPI0022477318|nr:RNA polymerase sigma-70 factor [Pedobacter sp. MC2016-15]MCX2478178.1 RNA polymerase sigma-70 factor [Pedobacter sp. MC2016-15]
MKDDFNQMFNNYKCRIYAYILAITKSEYVAEEITQEIFIKLWVARENLHEIKNLDGYVFKIARNLSLNHLRKVAYNEKMSTELIRNAANDGDSAETKLNLFDYNKLINQAVDGLSPQRRLVFKLSKEDELSYDEIASQLKLSKNTVKNHHLTAMGIVRSFLIKNGISSAVTVLFLFTC